MKPTFTCHPRLLIHQDVTTTVYIELIKFLYYFNLKMVNVYKIILTMLLVIWKGFRWTLEILNYFNNNYDNRLINKSKHIFIFCPSRFSERAQKEFKAKNNNFEDLSLGENRPTELIKRFSSLYSESRVDALDALDEIQQLEEMGVLKGKILFSIVVVS